MLGTAQIDYRKAVSVLREFIATYGQGDNAWVWTETQKAQEVYWSESWAPVINLLSSIFVRITSPMKDWEGTKSKLPGHLQRAPPSTGEREWVEKCISTSEQFSKGASHTGLKSQEKLREGGWMGPKGWADKAICSTRVKAKKAPVQQLRDKALLLLTRLEESVPKAQAHRTVGKQGIKMDICPLDIHSNTKRVWGVTFSVKALSQLSIQILETKLEPSHPRVLWEPLESSKDC